MKELSRHIVVDFYGCDPQVLRNLDLIRTEMLEAISGTGSAVIGGTFYGLGQFGVYGTVMVAENSLTIRTWPQDSFATVVLFNCGASLDILETIYGFRGLFLCSRVFTTEMRRGLSSVDTS